MVNGSLRVLRLLPPLKLVALILLKVALKHQKSKKSNPITTNILSSNDAHGEVYLIQHYLSVTWEKVGGFLRVLRFPPTNNTDHYDITEILLKAALSTIALQVYKFSEITIDYCGETCLSQTLKKTQSFINPTLNIQCSSNNYYFFINLTFINQPPVYYNHKSWSQGDWL